ncbi:MAG: iron complex outermembrane recepter protein [bacterium P3]|nr:MAG: iron complex outermembrane recepter protein [bacterium P3]KWW40420.1 MAG: iron complex outermembrane recepter protein [bacterium F083]
MVILGLFPSVAARGQDTAHNACRQLEALVVTATRTPKLLKDVPVVTRIISHHDFESLDIGHLPELLQAELPGIEFTYAMNQQLSLNMQGFGGNGILFLVDGERLAGETLDNIDYARLNLDNVEHIEIVKGSASALYGSNAVGGVVNLVSRNAGEPWSLRLNGHYGSYRNQRYGASLGFSRKRFSSETHAQHTACDPIRMAADGDFGTLYGNHTWHIKERITVTPTDKMKLSARAGFFFRERESQATVHDRYRDFSGGLKGDYAVSGRSALTVGYTFDQYDKSNYLLTGGYDVRTYSNVQHTTRALYNHTFNPSHTVTAGGDVMRDYLMSYQFGGDGAHRQYTADAFVQWDWTPDDRVNIVSAVRYDYYSLSAASHLSPKVSAMYKLPRVTLRATYAGGFRAPTLKEMYMVFDMANIFMIYGNPDLLPEKSDNFNLSAEYSHSHYNVTAMGFYNHIRNHITTYWNTALNGMRYANMEPVGLAGVDLAASARWDNGVGMRLSYTYTRERVTAGGMQTSSTRPHAATLRLDYRRRWSAGTCTVALGGRAMSAVTCDEYTSYTDLSQTARRTYPGYMLWRFNISQEFKRGVTLTATVDNLFDYTPDYYYSNSPATPGRTYAVGLTVDIDKL